MSTPGSVYGSPIEMMNAVFESSQPYAGEGPGPEKRLEFDLRELNEDAQVNERVVRLIAETLPLPADDCVTTPDGCYVVAEAGMVLYTAQRVIVTVDMSVALHLAVPKILKVLATAGFEPEWASFTRKNIVCPWDGRGAVIAHEYAVLKDCFPAGSPFVFGPVDAHHYFYFVYDNLHRTPGLVESDVQINVKLYNCTATEGQVTVGTRTIPLDATQRHFISLRGNTYESLRLKHLKQGNLISYETNQEAASALPELAEQIKSLKPDRFTCMLLLDPQSETGKSFASQRSIHLEAELFNGYRLGNRMSNTFEHGYAVVKASFVKI
jgi:S-adenosylmethionine decarboxylase